MPSKMKRICKKIGCTELTENTYCPLHTKEVKQINDSKRENSNARGYNSRWRKARATYLSKHPLCVECEKQGIVKLATDLDHIIPHKGNSDLFWDSKSNWQGLCHEHHSKKTATEDGGFGNSTVYKWRR